MKSLAMALIKHERITTTVAKAKELRVFIEPLVTRAKEDSMHNRRLAFTKLQDKSSVTKLFDEIGPASKDRPGGYTRVLKLGFRSGDGAETALIELVDMVDTEAAPKRSGESRKKTRRSRRGSGSTKTETTATEQEAAAE
jgi:large subunit ribosomal protein L17